MELSKTTKDRLCKPACVELVLEYKEHFEEMSQEKAHLKSEIIFLRDLEKKLKDKIEALVDEKKKLNEEKKTLIQENDALKIKCDNFQNNLTETKIELEKALQKIEKLHDATEVLNKTEKAMADKAKNPFSKQGLSYSTVSPPLNSVFVPVQILDEQQEKLESEADSDTEDIEVIECEKPNGERAALKKDKDVVSTENDQKVETSKLSDSKISAEKQSAFWKVKELNQQKEIKMTYTESSQSKRSNSSISSKGSVTGNNRCLICGKYGHNHNICYYNPDKHKPQKSQANKAKRKRRNKLYHNNLFQSSSKHQKPDNRWNNQRNEKRERCDQHFQSVPEFHQDQKKIFSNKRFNQQSDFDSFDNSRWSNCQGNNLWCDEFANVQQNVNMNNSMFSIPEQRSRFDPNQGFSENCSQVIPTLNLRDFIIFDEVTQQPKIIKMWVLMNN